MSDKVGQTEWELNNIPGLLERIRILLGIDPDGGGVPDATTIVKGKVELATDAETITGTDAVRATTPAGVAAAIAAARSGVAGVTFAVGASDTGTVGIQLTDPDGGDLGGVGVVTAYLADTDVGLAPTAADPSGGTAIGTDGTLLDIGTTGLFTLISEADGDIDLVVTEAGAATWYLAVVLPNGSIVVSSAIVFV